MKKKKNFEYYLIVFLFTILIVVCFLQVLFRFVFNLPLAWTEELSRYVFIILIYCQPFQTAVRLSQKSYGRPVCTGCCHVLPDCLQIPAGSV